MPIPEQRLGTVALNPAARVVDTYSRPAQAQEGLGMQLARALGEIEPGVRQYLSKKQVEKDKVLEARAQKLAFTDGIREVTAIQDGTLYPQESKTFMAMYRHQKGKFLSEQWRGEAEVAFNEAGLQNSTDPKEFETFFGTFIKDRLDGVEDTDVLQGALGGVQQLSNNLSLQNGALVASNLQKQYLTDAMGQLSTVIDNEMIGAARDDRDFNLANVMKEVNASNAKAMFLKLDGAAFRKQFTDLVIDKAVNDADPALLDILDQKFDNGLPLSDGYWKTKRDETIRAIDARAVQIEQQRYEQGERIKKQKLEQGQSFLLTTLSKNPYAQITSAQLQEFEGYAPGLGEAAITLRSKLIESKEKVATPVTLAAMSDFMRNPTDLSKLFTAVQSGAVDASMLRWGMTAYERAAKIGNGDASEGWAHVKRHPAVSPFAKRFENASQDPFLKGLQEDFPQAVSEAESEFNLDMLEFFEKNPEATGREVRKYAAETFKEITEGVKERLDAPAAPAATSGTPKAPAASPAAAPAQEQAPQQPFDQFDETT